LEFDWVIEGKLFFFKKNNNKRKNKRKRWGREKDGA